MGAGIPMHLLLGHRTLPPPGRQSHGVARSERSCWPAGALCRSWRSRAATRRCWRTSRSARETAARGPPSWHRSGSESRCDQVGLGWRVVMEVWAGPRMHRVPKSSLAFLYQGSHRNSGSASCELRDIRWTCTTLWI